MTHKSILLTCPLFRGFPLDMLLSALPYLGAEERSYIAGEREHRPYRSGECLLCLSGKAALYRGGRRCATLLPGDFFGVEELSFSGKGTRLTVLAEDDSVLLFLSLERLLLPPEEDTPHPLRDALQRNLLRMKSAECEDLRRRVLYLSEHTVRERLTAFFRQRREMHHSPVFPLGGTVSELAFLLAVNRSSLSTELTKMKAEGLLTVENGEVTLTDKV